MIRKTGEGKLAVLQAVCCMGSGVAICVTPLLGLCLQQRSYFSSLCNSGITAIKLNILNDEDAKSLVIFLEN